MATAAESDPALAKLLKKTPNSGWQEYDSSSTNSADFDLMPNYPANHVKV